MSDGGFLRRYPPSRIQRGFTLVELAVVVLVVGLLIGSLLVPLSTQVDQRNAAETQRRLEDAREALIGFAISNGRFPCPASSTSNGVESFCSNGDFTAACGAPTTTTPIPNHGRCSNPYDGYVPGAQLGLNNLDSSGYALDAWPLDQSRIRYAISEKPFVVIGGVAVCVGIKGCPATTTPGGMRTAGIGAIGGSVGYLYVCASFNLSTTNCGTAVTLAAGNAVFLVYSLGKNGLSDMSQDEQRNTAGIKVFVNKPYSSAASAGFDDQLLWVSSYPLISRLVMAGVLP